MGELLADAESAKQPPSCRTGVVKLARRPLPAARSLERSVKGFGWLMFEKVFGTFMASFFRFERVGGRRWLMYDDLLGTFILSCWIPGQEPVLRGAKCGTPADSAPHMFGWRGCWGVWDGRTGNSGLPRQKSGPKCF